MASDVIRALDSRWPDDQYLKIPEAPQDASRGGRKIDLLVVSLWASRGFELHAVEVKVSMSDWRRELDNGEKGDWWWRHVHRFWVAVPQAMADKVKAQLPPTWGLLACGEEGAPVAVVQAPRHKPEPMPWSTCIGIMRASADAGFGALQRADERGYDRGFRAGKLDADRQSGESYLQQQFARLQRTVADFEAMSGLALRDYSAGDLGRAVAIVRRWTSNPEWFLQQMAGSAERLTRQGVELAAFADGLRADLGLGAPAAPEVARG